MRQRDYKRQQRNACVGWFGGMEDLGCIISVGLSVEVDFEDECSFEFTSTLFLVVATIENLLTQDNQR